LPRRAFLAALPAVLAGRDTEPPPSLILVDVDHLSGLNSAFGHSFGDQVLRAIGTHLKRNALKPDAIGRLDGGTFGLVLSRPPRTGLLAAANRLVRCLSTDLLQLNPQALVTLSAGVAEPARGWSGTASELIAAAEKALRQAKNQGRNQAVSCPVSDGSHAEPAAAAGRRLQDALDTKRLTLAFQPVACATTGETAFHECLLRLPGDGGELIAAADLVPVAEDTGLIRAIDRWVLDRVICELAADRYARLSLNVSAYSVMGPDWIAQLEKTCRLRHGIAERLIVEITETAAGLNARETAAFALRVRQTGAQVALDDFGTGYTSIAHLRRLPIDIVKIDGAFTYRAAHNTADRLVLEALIRLAEGLGFATVAERAETSADAAFLAKCGARYVQGYAIGKPARRRLPACVAACV
jgi:diguanylate cyclase (GGDEF)-like protein